MPGSLSNPRTQHLCLLGAAQERLARPLSAEQSPGPGPPCSVQAGLRQSTPGPAPQGSRDPSLGLVSSGPQLTVSQQVQEAEGRGASEEPQEPVVWLGASVGTTRRTPGVYSVHWIYSITSTEFPVPMAGSQPLRWPCKGGHPPSARF